ncbi:phospho-N-acetylmuramoyl-pentapeptide-transferase [Candidatus Blochmanniella vafra str. BVAF]|uniref:Phospho-N-acetylmuramoyl-pentapeptide-transferase n=1 Tax=Blochmanniella vafra (strain BVAF) TaxID=859654 RepID=E8Q5Q0_BLOVB|nr:phospho-N-acetylmuramoyl-pentapeptide-transferase [Candidatus Blochmannia vafer]ADV33547.1 phospho-N-acetylmuramoyl-pentapeptide-transferase [Candidatus Blochmannia vafer str. BVAF]
MGLYKMLCLFMSNHHVIDTVFFKSFASFFSALVVALGIGSVVIIWLRHLCVFQTIRVECPDTHRLKRDTPTMGGIIMLISSIVSILMWADLSNLYVWYVLFIFIVYGLLGWIDDFLKIKRKNALGMRGLNKYFWQTLSAFLLSIVIFMMRIDCINTDLEGWYYLKDIVSKLDIWGVLLSYFVIVGTSNSTNLSDGLDGLAIVLIILITTGLIVIAWISSNVYFSNYLQILYIDRVQELIIICAAIIGTGLGFLWFNSYPAQIFMGDTGSLSFGGAIGVITVLLQQEYLLLVIGGIFVMESLSVILQVSYFKIFKKRIFKMTPIHHHFELQGCPEPKLVVRFWIISLVLLLLGLTIVIFKII